MSEEANADAGAGEQPEAAPKEAAKTVSHEAFTGVVEQRQALKGTVREQAAQLAEYQAREQEAKEAAQRAQGENEQIIAARDEALAAATSELAALQKSIRFKNTVAAVAAKSGLDSVMTEALLLREELVSGTDVALDELNDDSVTLLAKALRASAPALFQTEGVGGSPTIPGLSKGNASEGGKYTNLAKRLSPGGAK